jgi:hypothetical protein
MQRFLINGVNGALLVLIFIGIPTISHKQFWNWQVSSAPTAQKLIFGGLILAIAANVFGATIFFKNPKAKELCAKWSFIFGGFLFMEFAIVRGWLNFDWLKNSLLWLQNHF